MIQATATRQAAKTQLEAERRSNEREVDTLRKSLAIEFGNSLGKLLQHTICSKDLRLQRQQTTPSRRRWWKVPRAFPPPSFIPAALGKSGFSADISDTAAAWETILKSWPKLE
jgi:hypothetical protein